MLNLKREDVIRRSAEELSLKNDLLRRLVRELINPGEKKEPLKIYADNKESYFQASYITIMNTDADTDESHNLGDVILLKISPNLRNWIRLKPPLYLRSRMS